MVTPMPGPVGTLQEGTGKVQDGQKQAAKAEQEDEAVDPVGKL